MAVAFVGRQAELDELDALHGRARADRAPAAALVTGEPGSGKTRLLAEAVRRAHGTPTIMMAGYEPSQSIPLSATAGLLRRLTKVPTHGAVLERLAFGREEQPTRDPLRVFEATVRATASLGPLLISIDDLQWVDEQSLALVDYLLRSTVGQPLIMVAAARPSPASAAFRARAEAMLPAERWSCVELGPLRLADGQSLARAIDGTLDEEAASNLWRRARGSPFWLEVLAHTRGGGIPSVAIEDRFRALSGDAGSVLALLAVAGRPVPADDIALMLGWKTELARKAAQELVDRGLALHDAGSLRLAHDLIREAAIKTLPVAALRHFHRLLAESIEADAGDDLQVLCEALEHRAAGGLPTAALAARLTGSPQRRLLTVENLRLLASISDALKPGTSEQLTLDRDLGELAGMLGEQELAMARWARVSQHAADPAARQDAEIEAARAAYRLARPQEAHVHLDRARDLGPSAPEIEARIDALRAEVHLWFDHDTAAGARAAERAISAAREMAAGPGGLEGLSITQRRTYLGALEAAIGAALQEERIDDVRVLTETSLIVAPAIDDESHVAALLRSAFGLRPLGAVRESETYFRQAWELSQRSVMPLSTVEAGHGLARALRDMGSLAEAREVAAAVVVLEARLGHPPARWGNASAILHAIELSLGDSGALQALRMDAKSEPNPHYRLAVHQTIATWQARAVGASRATEVQAELAAAGENAERAGCPRCAAEVSIVSAELLARIGMVDDAKRSLAVWEWRPVADYLQREIWRLRARSAIAAAEGNRRTAGRLLEELAARLDGAALLDELAWARLDLGRLLAGSDRARAVEALGAAAELAERIGAASIARLAAQELRRLGVRAWRRGPASDGAGLAALSAREREVAGLVAAGESNRAIAESLLVSPKTVERHLTNILAKLGLRNRAELAALVGSDTVRGSPDE